MLSKEKWICFVYLYNGIIQRNEKWMNHYYKQNMNECCKWNVEWKKDRYK